MQSLSSSLSLSLSSLSSVFLLFFLISSCLITPQVKGNLLGEIFGKMIRSNVKGSPNLDCAACTGVVAIVEQMAQVHNKSVDKVISDLCSYLPESFKAPCDGLILLYGPAVIKLIENNQTPDEVCQEIGLCRNNTCNIFPKRTKRSNIQGKISIPSSSSPSFSKVASFNWPWDRVANHLPALDEDGDYFGVLPTLRGSHWRGKDCDDGKADVYPGRNINDYGPETDHNCNGISGIDNNSSKTWEDLLCSGTTQYGFILLGDSAGAHFHVPPAYMTPALIDNETFSNLLEILEDEFDWPEMSSSTGYMNESWVGHPIGPLDSIYARMRERNLCMHRDFQNIAVNGARSGTMNNTISITMSRNQKYDHPVFLSYALIGNDVCNGHFGTKHMTTPQQFYENVFDTLKFLDTKLPNGSHVSFMGLVDGRILYESMATRIHPIGLLNNDVTYSDFYDYLNCLEISPCFGWMNSDEYWRNATTERANELNQVYKDIISNNTFENFDMTYFDCPLEEVLNTWVAQGGEPWDIIEPIDGFHPNQIANALLAEVQWKKLMVNFSYLLPPINPNNDLIAQLFGDQG